MPSWELFGREPEKTRIDSLLSGARSGTSEALVFHGEPGIGKSSLLSYAEETASDMQVLRAEGVEAESELAFGGLLELLCPVLDLLSSIPSHRQRRWRLHSLWRPEALIASPYTPEP